ncbi:MAG: hypothetical protein JXA54_02505 [Candidatus Heimdallarchaeota archaeon]|nr:hypothetical protein [Candidatus Heimdallarchaeota archaeon]
MNKSDDTSTKVKIQNWPKNYPQLFIAIISILVALISVIVAYNANRQSNEQVRLSRKAFIVPTLIKDDNNRAFLELENVTDNAALHVNFSIYMRRGKEYLPLWSDSTNFIIPGRQKRLYYLKGIPEAYAVLNKFGVWENNRDLYFKLNFSDFADPSYNMTKEEPPIKLYKYYKFLKSSNIDFHLIMNLQDVTSE